MTQKTVAFNTVGSKDYVLIDLQLEQPNNVPVLLYTVV